MANLLPKRVALSNPALVNTAKTNTTPLAAFSKAIRVRDARTAVSRIQVNQAQKS